MKRLAALVALATGLMATAPASAGPMTDALGQCLVAKASPADRTDLMRWVFAMISLHPDIQSLATVDPAAREEATKKAAGLLQRFLTVDCRTEFVAAFKAEGMLAIEGSFQVLGETAASGLFGAPEVAAGMAGLTSHVDQAAMAEVMKEAQQ